MANNDQLLTHITGNLGKDPETADTKVGTIVRMSVAVTMKYGKDDGITRWVQVALFDERRKDDQDDELSPLQRQAMKKLEKGSKVAVEGVMKVRKVDGKTYYDLSAKRIGVVDWFLRENGGNQASSRSSSSDDDEDGEALAW